MLPNQVLRDYMKSSGVAQHEIAREMGVCEMTIQRKLRNRLSDKEMQDYKHVIDHIREAKLSSISLEDN